MMIHSYLINLHCNVFKNLFLIFYYIRKRIKERELEAYLLLFLTEVEALLRSHMQVFSLTFICDHI